MRMILSLLVYVTNSVAGLFDQIAVVAVVLESLGMEKQRYERYMARVCGP